MLSETFLAFNGFTLTARDAEAVVANAAGELIDEQRAGWFRQHLGTPERRPSMFIAAYWWKVHPGKEEQFRAAWRHGTELIRAKYGSLGSRLHWEAETGRFIGIAEWPDRETWQRAFDAKMTYDDPQVRADFVGAISDWADDPMLLLEVTDDLLGRAPVEAGASTRPA